MNLEKIKSPEQFNITRVNENDWEKYRELRLHGLQTDPDSFGRSYEEEFNFNPQHWKDRISDPSRLYYVASASNKFVSTALSHKYKDDTWSIQGVYTMPEFRNKNLAKEIIEKLIDDALTKGAKYITLAVNSENKLAIGFYKKIGFEIFEGESYKKIRNGKILNYYNMRKIL